MPLRYIRRKVTVNSVLTTAVATTATATNLAGIVAFPPVALPAAVLLKIFQTIQGVQTNREQCYQLAYRCLSFLDLFKDQIRDRPGEAPPSLLEALRKFTETLESLQSFLLSHSDSKRGIRLKRKGSVESALANFNAELDHAFKDFQIATLINIHYTIGEGLAARPSQRLIIDSTTAIIDAGPTGAHVSETPELTSSPLVQTSDESQSTSSRQTSTDTGKYSLVNVPSISSIDFPSQSGVSENFALTDEEKVELEHHGFRRYDESDISLKRRVGISEGWFAGTGEVEVDRRTLLVKGYDGLGGVRRWIRDVKILQNVFHPNLPQMVGYSGTDCPTPFILLANVQTRLPQALVLDAIEHRTLAECLQLITRFYVDHMDAARYLQCQLDLSESKIQDYVENANYRIDGERTLVMGLPPPEIDRVQSWRNFDLAHSVRKIYLDILPNRGINIDKPSYVPDSTASLEMQLKINNISQILTQLLPSSEKSGQLNKLQDLLEDSDEESLTMRQLRVAALDIGATQHAWREGLVPAYKYAVGDLGYLTKPGDFSSFKLLCNVVTKRLALFPITLANDGSQIQWGSGPLIRNELQPFPCPGNRHGWAVNIPPGGDISVNIIHQEGVNPVGVGWRYLLDYGQYFASQHGVKAEKLILITRVGVELRFKVKGPFVPFSHRDHGGFHSSTPGHHSHMQSNFGHPPMQGGFGHAPRFGQMGTHFGMQPQMPTILYLSTSGEKAGPPIWSQSPVFDYQSEPPYKIANCLVCSEPALGFLSYVQLTADDFLGAEVHPPPSLTRPSRAKNAIVRAKKTNAAVGRSVHSVRKSSSSFRVRQ